MKCIYFFVFFAIASYASAQVASGSNTYLPPTTNGYSYPEPPKPFNPKPNVPTGQRPNTMQRPGDDHVHVPGMPYDFEYAVNDVPTSNDYSHKASSDGDVVNGEYRVFLPDGRTQVVRYTADWKTGFHADVSYEGEPTYQQGQSNKAQNVYKY